LFNSVSLPSCLTSYMSSSFLSFFLHSFIPSRTNAPSF
jgi:hypothetical protein